LPRTFPPIIRERERETASETGDCRAGNDELSLHCIVHIEDAPARTQGICSARLRVEEPGAKEKRSSRADQVNTAIGLTKNSKAVRERRPSGGDYLIGRVRKQKKGRIDQTTKRQCWEERTEGGRIGSLASSSRLRPHKIRKESRKIGKRPIAPASSRSKGRKRSDTPGTEKRIPPIPRRRKRCAQKRGRSMERKGKANQLS